MSLVNYCNNETTSTELAQYTYKNQSTINTNMLILHSSKFTRLHRIIIIIITITITSHHISYQDKAAYSK